MSYDWNGNGSNDSFDSYMDYEISNSRESGHSTGGTHAPHTARTLQNTSSGLSCFGLILSFIGGFFLMVLLSCVFNLDIGGMPMVVFIVYVFM